MGLVVYDVGDSHLAKPAITETLEIANYATFPDPGKLTKALC